MLVAYDWTNGAPSQLGAKRTEALFGPFPYSALSYRRFSFQERYVAINVTDMSPDSKVANSCLYRDMADSNLRRVS
jgi:hypothetical protein